MSSTINYIIIGFLPLWSNLSFKGTINHDQAAVASNYNMQFRWMKLLEKRCQRHTLHYHLLCEKNASLQKNVQACLLRVNPTRVE